MKRIAIKRARFGKSVSFAGRSHEFITTEDSMKFRDIKMVLSNQYLYISNGKECTIVPTSDIACMTPVDITQIELEVFGAEVGSELSTPKVEQPVKRRGRPPRSFYGVQSNETELQGQS